jgi:hypothetical protein
MTGASAPLTLTAHLALLSSGVDIPRRATARRSRREKTRASHRKAAMSTQCHKERASRRDCRGVIMNGRPEVRRDTRRPRLFWSVALLYNRQGASQNDPKDTPETPLWFGIKPMELPPTPTRERDLPNRGT